MRCPKCGYISFDFLETCRRCGKDSFAKVSISGTAYAAAAPDFLLQQAGEEVAAEEAPIADAVAVADEVVLAEADGLAGDLDEALDDDLEIDFEGFAAATEAGAAVAFDVESATDPGVEDQDLAAEEEEDLELPEDLLAQELPATESVALSETEPEEVDGADGADEAQAPVEESAAVGLELPPELADLSDLAPPDDHGVGDDEELGLAVEDEDEGEDGGGLDLELELDDQDAAGSDDGVSIEDLGFGDLLGDDDGGAEDVAAVLDDSVSDFGFELEDLTLDRDEEEKA